VGEVEQHQAAECQDLPPLLWIAAKRAKILDEEQARTWMDEDKRGIEQPIHPGLPATGRRQPAGMAATSRLTPAGRQQIAARGHAVVAAAIQPDGCPRGYQI